MSLIYSFLLTVFLLVLAIELNFLWLFGTMPSINKVSNPDLPMASEIYSADGLLLGKFFKENREPVEYAELNPQLIDALIVTEDARFYKHYGIDIQGTAAALIATTRGEKRGGSTLSQQLAKNLFKTRRRHSQGLLASVPGIRTLVVKSKEWITAVKLELFYTKEEILTLYLNTVDFGHNTFGIKVAAETYFGVAPSALTVPQSATLVGMLKAPSYYSPLRHPERCKTRRDVVLGQLLRYGKITSEAHSAYVAEPLGIRYREYSYTAGIAPYFRTAVARSLEKWQKETGYNIYTDGLIIHTTLDSRMQAHAEKAMALQMRQIQQRFESHWAGRAPWTITATASNPEGFLMEVVRASPAWKNRSRQYKGDEKQIFESLHVRKPMKIFTWNGEKEVEYSSLDSIKHYLTLLQCGMVTLDPYTGKVKAYIGGIDYNFFKYDHVSVALNQPGSTFKPFVYATAFEQGWGPCDRLPDLPVTIRYTEKGEQKSWTPRNSDWVNTGAMLTLRHAMGKSVNTVTARLTEKTGWAEVARTARKMGIKSALKEVPSIGLGSNDVTLLELVGAYGTFMNKGLHTEPYYVSHITDRSGKVVAVFLPEVNRALDPETAWLMTYMLRGGMEEPGGTSQALWEFNFVHHNEVGGKTGTSSNYSDGWYIGVTAEYITGVWVGADDNRIRFRTSETGEGARTALPIYGRYMDMLYADPALKLRKGKFPEPSIPITKAHNCRTFAPIIDSLRTDSIPMLPETPLPIEEVQPEEAE